MKQELKKVFTDNSLWEYGTCNGMYARRHKVNKKVQFIIFKKGDQKYVDGIGHTEDNWVNFDSSWWDGFHSHKLKLTALFATF